MAKTNKEYFRFQKVEDYFCTADAWDTVQKVDGCQWEQEKRTLILHLKTSAPEHQDCDLLIQIVTGSSFRLRFHPEKKAGDYSEYNSRAVIRDSFSEMQDLITTNDFYAKFDDSNENYAELGYL